MPFTTRFVTRFGTALGAAAVAGATLLGVAAPAFADDAPPPNCSAADLAGVLAGVSASTSAYLFTHPDVNAFFTSLKGKPRDEMRDEITAYFGANPQVGADLRGIRQSSLDFRARCGLEDPIGSR
jgi:heme-binding protein